MKLVRISALTVLAAMLSTPVVGQVTEPEIEALPLEHLKRVYLACEAGVANGTLDSGSVGQCSIVYELLKRRAFEGDFERLFAWSREALKQGQLTTR